MLMLLPSWLQCKLAFSVVQFVQHVQAYFGTVTFICGIGRTRLCFCMLAVVFFFVIKHKSDALKILLYYSKMIINRSLEVQLGRPASFACHWCAGLFPRSVL